MSWPDPGPRRWLLRNVTLADALLDCRIADGRIAQLGPGLDPGDDPVADGGGGALLPGLADHHLHLIATAAARASVDLGGGTSLGLAADGPRDGWLRVVGAGTEWTRADLDRRWPDGPVRVQHRSGRLWMLNSAAIARLGDGLTETERRAGQLWDSDTRLRALLGDGELPDLTALGAELAGRGVTHVTDASADLSPETVRAMTAAVPQHAVSMAATGTGPRKLVLSDVHLPDADAVTAAIAGAHRDGRPVAIHTVTELTLAIALAALSAAGVITGDRLEHVTMCSDGAAGRIADLGVTVVTQPTIYAAHHAAFLRDTPVAEHPLLWRHAGLLARGIPVAVSSDAPYGDPDPAATLLACAARPVEGVSATRALQTMLTPLDDPAGRPRQVEVGAGADLCLLTGGLGPALRAAADGDRWPVAATMINGEVVYTLNHLSI